jgi:hypothetical protein
MLVVVGLYNYVHFTKKEKQEHCTKKMRKSAPQAAVYGSPRPIMYFANLRNFEDA